MDYRYLLIILLLIPMSTALEFNSGEVNELIHLPVCYNEAKVRVTTLDLPVESNFKIVNCTKVDNNNWVCPCSGEPLTISFSTTRRTKNEYNFLIHYQTENYKYSPIDISVGPTWEQQQYQIYSRNTRINNVVVRPEGFVVNPNLQVNMRNAVITGILVVLLIGGVLYFKNKDTFKVSNNDDVLSYSNKKDENIDDILNMIK